MGLKNIKSFIRFVQFHNLIWVSLLVMVLNACIGPFAPSQPPAPTRTTVETTLPLRQLWHKAPILRYRLGSQSSSTLAAGHGIIYIVNQVPDSPDAAVLALDANTGTQLWATRLLSAIHSLAVGENALYVSGSFGVKAFEDNGGALKWTSNIPRPDHTAYILFFEDSLLKLFMPGPHKFTTLDLNSGAVGEVHRVGDMVAVDSQYRYLWDRSQELFRVEERPTGQIRWQISITVTSVYFPMRVANRLVIPTVTSNASWYSVVVVDRDSGQMLWTCSDCFTSDVAVDGGRLYAIQRDGSLGAYDLETGQVLGAIRFEGGAPMAPNALKYAIAAADGRVFVYFGDSQELIALGP